jgi:glutathione peroxidase
MLIRSLLALPALVGTFLSSGCAADGTPPAKSVHEFVLTANDGKPYPLAQHAGKVLLIVNTASKCGLTKQYAPLEQVWKQYQARGLVVIGIPSNDFLGQEPGTNEEIAAFCSTKFGVTFPLMAKVAVSGGEQAPLYRYLTQHSAKPGKITWNFNKFLVGPDGQVIDRFDARQDPGAPEVTAVIEKALGALK